MVMREQDPMGADALSSSAPASVVVDASDAGSGDDKRASSSSSDPASRPAAIKPPKLRLHIQDLAHPGTAKFLRVVPNAGDLLAQAVGDIDRLLYRPPDGSKKQGTRPHAPPTRSVTLVLEDMDGVAYTTGSDLDDDHKEIHFSLRYIDSIHPEELLASEIRGVLTHELVHCYQWNACGTCPGGLIEGVADWVRLRCGLEPPHWRKHPDGDWASGYEQTAYFLQYLETRFGPGTVQEINAKMRRHKYRGGAFWCKLLGKTVDELYANYVKEVTGGEGDGEGDRSDDESCS
ncbi:hypothetical protein VTJ83DRAFT_4976 [Remersonia thermophila]|uniref:Uncharacterized protein n=1 Tax=Remersonia thermophila TaxID=72144 RepID=A0ABR4DBG6_9PEZI